MIIFEDEVDVPSLSKKEKGLAWPSSGNGSLVEQLGQLEPRRCP